MSDDLHAINPTHRGTIPSITHTAQSPVLTTMAVTLSFSVSVRTTRVAFSLDLMDRLVVRCLLCVKDRGLELVCFVGMDLGSESFGA